MYIQESYSVKQKGNVVVFKSPEFLAQYVVDAFLIEVEEVIQKLLQKSAAIPNGEQHLTNRCTIVLDFSDLEESNMETSQMAQFVTIMSKYGLNKLFAIPPGVPESGESRVISLLNKSLPMFGKNGILVVFEKPRKDPLYYLYPRHL